MQYVFCYESVRSLKIVLRNAYRAHRDFMINIFIGQVFYSFCTLRGQVFLLARQIPTSSVQISYSAKQWWGKTLANQSFQSFGEENVGKFKFLALS